MTRDLKSLSDDQLLQLHTANRYDHEVHEERLRRDQRRDRVVGLRRAAIVVAAIVALFAALGLVAELTRGVAFMLDGATVGVVACLIVALMFLVMYLGHK